LCTSSFSSYTIQFSKNIARIRDITKKWLKSYNERSQGMLKEEESQILKLYEENVLGTFSDNDFSQLRALESSQKYSLEKEEAT